MALPQNSEVPGVGNRGKIAPGPLRKGVETEVGSKVADFSTQNRARSALGRLRAPKKILKTRPGAKKKILNDSEAQKSRGGRQEGGVGGRGFGEFTYT